MADCEHPVFAMDWAGADPEKMSAGKRVTVEARCVCCSERFFLPMVITDQKQGIFDLGTIPISGSEAEVAMEKWMRKAEKFYGPHFEAVVRDG